MSSSPRTLPHQAPGLLKRLGKLTSIRDTDLLEQSLLKTLGGLLGLVQASLYRTDTQGNLVRIIHHRRNQSVDDQGVTRLVESVEEINNVQGLEQELLDLMNNVRELAKPYTQTINGVNLLAYPMNEGHAFAGILVFAPHRDLSPSEDSTIRGILEVFANYSGLLDVSQRDQLTGLLNRQALQHSFNRVWANIYAESEDANKPDSERRRAAPQSYWLGVIDIDHFKRVNDTYGHIVGDEILLLVSRHLCQALRSSDLIYRYGGEEFVVIMRADSEARALAVFERLRTRIESQTFPRAGKVTISIGICAADARVLPQEALSCADRSLYEAKQQGRNRVCEYGDLLRRGIFKEVDYGDTELF